MDTLLYTAYLGMRARQRALDANANNIANTSTAGYKGERTTYASVEAAAAEGSQPAEATSATSATSPAVSQGPRALGVLAGNSTDFSVGPLRETGRPLDAAIEGEGFFVVQTPRGTRYARAGNFTLDSSGQLVTPAGDLVVGETGPITVPAGNVAIGQDGTVSVNGQTIDKLKLVRFDNPASALLKEGGSLFAPTGAAQPLAAERARVVQGALEASNVNGVTELVSMMQNGREFDSLQRAITLTRELGRRVASEIGKI